MSVTVLVVKSYFHTAPAMNLSRQQGNTGIAHTIASVHGSRVIIR